MTMDAYALCDRLMSSIGAWQAAIDASGFDLTLDSSRDLATATGHLPATWRGREAGFAVRAIPLSGLAETYADVDLGGPWACVYAFSFATLPACAGTWLALAACVGLTGGVAFDPQEGLLLDPAQAARYARAAEDDVDRIERDTAGP